MKKYEAVKRIDGYYMVAEKKTCKPYSAMLYSTKETAKRKADSLNNVKEKNTK